jgi:phage antirepressor YoqD-like protein
MNEYPKIELSPVVNAEQEEKTSKEVAAVLGAKQKMTTKEVADVLGVDVKTVQRAALSLDMDVERSGSSHTMLFDEAQVTAIKLEIENHSKVNALTPKTNLERQLIIQQAMQIQAEMIEELQNKVSRLEPAANFAYQLCSSKDTIEIGECAKVLNKNIGRNRLFEFLRNSNVLQSNNIPYQKYIDAGYFRVIESKYVTPNGETKISLKTVVFQKGVAYINKLLSKAVENA